MKRLIFVLASIIIMMLAACTPTTPAQNQLEQAGSDDGGDIIPTVTPIPTVVAESENDDSTDNPQSADPCDDPANQELFFFVWASRNAPEREAEYLNLLTAAGLPITNVKLTEFGEEQRYQCRPDIRFGVMSDDLELTIPVTDINDIDTLGQLLDEAIEAMQTARARGGKETIIFVDEDGNSRILRYHTDQLGQFEESGRARIEAIEALNN